MKPYFLRLLASAIIILMGAYPAISGEAEFSVTDEFLNICSENETTSEKVENKFLELGWGEVEDRELSDMLKPDDFIEKVKNFKPFSVDLQDGGAWYGVSATGKIEKQKLGYCSVIIIIDDMDGLRADFEQASGLVGELYEPYPNEKRYVYSEDDYAHVIREITVEDTNLLEYAKLYKLSLKGK